MKRGGTYTANAGVLGDLPSEGNILWERGAGERGALNGKGENILRGRGAKVLGGLGEYTLETRCAGVLGGFGSGKTYFGNAAQEYKEIWEGGKHTLGTRCWSTWRFGEGEGWNFRVY